MHLDGLLLLHAAATLAMTGLVWFVQIVHYPLFDAVGAGEATTYARQHQRRTGWVVGPLMLVEGVTATALLAGFRDVLPASWLWGGLALLASIWLSTSLVQVPLHRRLAERDDRQAIARLVVTNWWRTAAWTARSIIALALVRVAPPV